MSAMHTYEAETRTAIGTVAAKKQRSAGLVPVTISKRGAPSRHATIASDQAKHLAKNVVHLCKVKLGKDEITTLKGEIAVHCLQDYIQHIDLQEVDAKSEIVVDVAVAPKADECPGIKSGGIVELRLRSVKVRCPASAIPDAIELDLSNVQVMESVYAKQLTMPKGCKLVTRGDLTVLSIVVPRWMKKADETAAAGTEGAAAPAADAAKAADGKAAPAADAKAGAKPDAKAAAPAKK
jgi:large subunit ribosomal protein L25